MSQIPSGVIPRRLLQEILDKASTLPLSVDADPTKSLPPNLPLARTLVAELLDKVRACIRLVEKDGPDHTLLSALETHFVKIPLNPSPLALRDWLVTTMAVASIGKDVIDGAPSNPLLEELFFPASPGGQTSPADRLSADELRRIVILDGRSYQVQNPSAFHLFVALFKAHIEGRTPLPVPELTAAAGFGSNTKPKPIFDRHLPSPIRAIVKSKAGHRGGYFLSLP